MARFWAHLHYLLIFPTPNILSHFCSCVKKSEVQPSEIRLCTSSNVFSRRILTVSLSSCPLRLRVHSCRAWVFTLWRSSSTPLLAFCTQEAHPNTRFPPSATCRLSLTSTCCRTPTTPTPSTPPRLALKRFPLLLSALLEAEHEMCLNLQGIGEPALFLGSSCFFAIKDAVAAARSDSGMAGPFTLDSPATPERACLACATPFTRKVTWRPYWS